MSSNSPVAIVTGGAQGLGLATVHVLLKADYKVCFVDVKEEKGKEVLKDLKQTYGQKRVIFERCDVSSETDVERVFERTLKEFQKIDLLVNNAGIVSEVIPRRIIDVNLIGTINGCHTAMKYMSKEKGGKGGFVINVASLAGYIPYPITPVYTSTKHGVVGLTRSYGHPVHFEKTGIMFVALCPNYMKTDMILKDGPVEYRDRLDMAEPSDVAQNILKIIKDKRNGSLLRVAKNEIPTYVNFPEEMQTFV